MPTLIELVRQDPDVFELWLKHPFTQAFLESLEQMLTNRENIILRSPSESVEQRQKKLNYIEQWKALDLARRNIISAQEILEHEKKLLQEWAEGDREGWTDETSEGLFEDS